MTPSHPPILCRWLVCCTALAVQAALVAAVDPPAQGLTAQECLDKAGKLFQERNYAEAAALYGRFAADFGQSKEGAELLRAVRFRQAMSLVQSRRLAESREVIEAALAAQPPLPAPEVQELRFWLGVALLEEKNYPSAREALEKFVAQFPSGAERNPAILKQSPAASRIPEARLLLGSAWILEGKCREAADYYASILPGLTAENRGRAVILQLHSLLEAGDDEAAMRLAAAEYPRMGEIIQIVTFQTLLLELGNRWMEKGELRKAIMCLQRVWTSERLLKHQQARLDDIQSRLQAAEANPGADPAAKVLLAQLVQKVKREIENFKKIQGFDSALRFRLAGAYLAMRRYREAALIMEDMLGRMPPDPAVEKATVNLVQCWNEIDRTPKAVEAARAFVKKFPASASIPLALYLEGAAEQKDSHFDSAVAAFDRILKEYSASEFAPRALFMKGFTFLLAERHAEAAAAFRQMEEKFPEHDLADAAAYWRGMAYSLDRQYEAARGIFASYLKDRKDGRFRGNAAYRHAYCTQQLEDYEGSIKELSAYLRAYPGHEENAEARVLLGDALMNEGRIDEGIAAFAGIPKSAGRFYEEGVFKTGKAYKLTEEYGKLRTLMAAFQSDNPRSPRVAEAIYHLGWIYRQEGKPEKAREVYWDAIATYGNDPDIRSVDDLFPALARLYKGPEESAQYLARLSELSARRDEKPVLALRALWAQSLVLKRSDPARASQLLLEASALVDPKSANPLLLADCADALIAAGRGKEGETMLRDLLRWNPRAAQKDRALAGLALQALQRGDEKDALALFERFAKESAGSRAAGRVLLAKAGLLERRGQHSDARKTLEAVLANPLSSGPEKAEALYRTGESHMADGNPGMAVPYFQRIYVMHGRWRDWVAKAYLRSGEAFELLDDKPSARRTYQESGTIDGLSEFPESARARERLEALGGPLPEPQPPAKG